MAGILRGRTEKTTPQTVAGLLSWIFSLQLADNEVARLMLCQQSTAWMASKPGMGGRQTFKPHVVLGPHRCGKG
jgi:hypothetical protein